MRISILEPKGAIWQGMVNKISLPASEGEMCVLDFHQSFVVRLRKGNILFSNTRISVKDGIAFMKSNNLTVFAQT
jgi:F0F1-type ATP synthase epsilon subunit